MALSEPGMGNAPLPLVSFQDIIKDALPPVDWLIEPIIANGDRVVVYGQFGSLKSWLLLHLGLSIAAGQPWLSTFDIPTPQSVLYVDEEMSVRTLRRRIKRLAMGNSLESEPLSFHVLSQPGITFDARGATTLLTGLAQQAFHPDVILIETLRRVLHGSENDAEAVSAFWKNIEPLRASGKTVIISHHMRKPYKEGEQNSRYRASGSTDILAGADSAFAIELEEDGLLRMTCVKARNAEEPQPFYVSLRDSDINGPIRMHFEGFHQDAPPKMQEHKRVLPLIREILATTPGGTIKTRDLIRQLEARGIAERTAQRALTTARKRGEVTPVRHGVWRWIPPAVAA